MIEWLCLIVIQRWLCLKWYQSYRDSVGVLLADFICFFNTFVCWYKLAIARGEARGAAYRTVDQKTRSTTHTRHNGQAMRFRTAWVVWSYRVLLFE